MIKIFWGLFIAVLSLQVSAGKEYFRIGEPDAMSREFKTFENLADSRYVYQRSELRGEASEKGRAFRDVDNLIGFYSKPVVFEVGKSAEKDFPFIHIIKGWDIKNAEISIKFEAPKELTKDVFFRIGISDMSATAPIGIKLFLNSKEVGELKGVNLNVGFGGALAYRPQAKGIPHSLAFKIPTELFNQGGENVLKIVPYCSKSPSWMTYDYLELTDSPNVPQIEDPRDGILDEAIKSMGTELVVFSTRGEGRDYHWYSNIGRTCWVKTGVPQIDERFDCEMFSRLGGKLAVYNLKTGEIKYLIDDPDGCVRDHTVSFDGKKILFSYRKGKSDTFHLYEIDTDGKNLVKLPVAREGVNDIEPAYLPNGDIVFASTRMGKTVQCFFMPVTGGIDRKIKSPCCRKIPMSTALQTFFPTEG